MTVTDDFATRARGYSRMLLGVGLFSLIAGGFLGGLGFGGESKLGVGAKALSALVWLAVAFVIARLGAPSDAAGRNALRAAAVFASVVLAVLAFVEWPREPGAPVLVRVLFGLLGIPLTLLPLAYASKVFEGAGRPALARSARLCVAVLAVSGVIGTVVATLASSRALEDGARSLALLVIPFVFLGMTLWCWPIALLWSFANGSSSSSVG
jgi:hypothetical protein